MAAKFPTLDISVESLSPTAFKRRLDDGEEWTMVDTRREADFQAWKLTHENLTVVNVPFTEFLDADETKPAASVPARVPDGPLVTCCAKGISSLYVGKFLAREGWDVLALEEGMEGWARLEEIRPVETAGDVTVVQFHRPSSNCLAYLLVSGDEAAVIDPLRAFASDYVAEARKRDATVQYAIETHVHADHVSGVRAVAELSDCRSVFPAKATERGLSFDATLIEAGETVSLGSETIEAVGLPGHTTEMTGYRFGGVFVTGDTLFLDSVARPDLEDEDAAREAAAHLWESLQRVETLPDEMRIAPAHVSARTAPESDGTFTATLGSLREGLGVFGDDKQEFIDRMVTDLPPRPNNYEQIIDINLGRESVSDEKAFELELGPNNCAVDS
ncbi:MBL fold metallo-hydrolase [Halovenus rubra]|uniref:MBL fold metallo-hydrolase n=2 Tax=Halovenus rubra TaxID=869890 RepID=A0ABD5XCS6_9EURY|nr:MBL fold metallo-hydrolase [Halovenus rubra]